MAASKKIQVTVDDNLYRVLKEMADANLRGKTQSEVAYNILEEWVWDNQEKLKSQKINLMSES